MSEFSDRRGTICVETGSVVWQRRYPAGQFVIRLRAPECARRARAGTFAHVSCGAGIPMRRPVSIMSADPDSGTVELLYKVVGPGLEALSHAGIGDPVSLIGPVGNGFSPNPGRTRPLLIGGGVGIPPVVFLAHELKASGLQPVVMMGSEVPFPFELDAPSHDVDGLANTMSMRALGEADIASRLASFAGLAGTFQGHVTDLAGEWLGKIPDSRLATVQLFACGPEPMLAATAQLAQKFRLPCQLCLEEFMACAVGGCAGCAVPIMTPEGMAMKRVCVDGPVFEAHTVYF